MASKSVGASKLWSRDELLGSAGLFCTSAERFADLEKQYRCSACLAFEPDVHVTHTCEHSLCESCAVQYVQHGTPCHCSEPLSLWRAPLPPAASSPSSSFSSSAPPPPPTYTKTSRRINGEVNELRFRCVRDGCEARDLKYGDWLTHCITRSCTMLPVACALCKQFTTVAHESKHLADECDYRPTTCTQCASPVKIPYNELVKHRYEFCPKTSIKCDAKGCPESHARDAAVQHRRECAFEVVPCDMQRFGCTFTGERHAHEAHLITDTRRHLRLFLDSYSALESQVVALLELVRRQTTPWPTSPSIGNSGFAQNGGGGTKPSHVSSSSAPSAPSGGGTFPVYADTKMSAEDRWRYLDLVLALPVDEMPVVLAADCNNEWFPARVKSRGPKFAVVEFLGFKKEVGTEEIELMSGRVRPVFRDVRDHLCFVDLKTGYAVDYRVTFEDADKQKRHVWKQGTIDSLTSTKVRLRNIGDDRKVVDEVEHVDSRFLPLNTVYGLEKFDSILFPHRARKI